MNFQLWLPLFATVAGLGGSSSQTITDILMTEPCLGSLRETPDPCIPLQSPTFVGCVSSSCYMALFYGLYGNTDFMYSGVHRPSFQAWLGPHDGHWNGGYGWLLETLPRCPPGYEVFGRYCRRPA